MTLTVGDHSGSHSERYALQVGRIRHQSAGFGIVSSRTYKFRRGTEHEIRLLHRGSNVSPPDYDYTSNVSISVSDGYVLDPDFLLGDGGTQGPTPVFDAERLTAILVVAAAEEDTNLPPEFLSNDETDPTIQTADKFNFYLGVSELNAQNFERTLTAGDPENDAMIWSIDQSNYFEIDPATGTLSLKNIPFSNRGDEITLNVTVTSVGGTDTAIVNIHIATEITLRSIDYTSDHDKLLQAVDDTFASNDGTRYIGPEWKRSTTWPFNAENEHPFSQSMGTSIDAKLRLSGVPSGFSYNLIGYGTGPNGTGYGGTYLDFEELGITGNTVYTTAESALPTVGQIDNSIHWTIIIDGQTVPVGITQNLIYVTYGEPNALGGTMTETRIKWITEAANGLSDPHEIVAAIQGASAADGEFALYSNPETVWAFLDEKVKCECIDHVKLIHAAASMLGVPGGQVGYVFPNTNSNIIGKYSTTPSSGFQTRIINGKTQRLLYKNGGPNNFEAVYKFTSQDPEDPENPANTITRYYAGFGPVPFYNSPKAVIGGEDEVVPEAPNNGVALMLQWWEWNPVTEKYDILVEEFKPSWME